MVVPVKVSRNLLEQIATRLTASKAGAGLRPLGLVDWQRGRAGDRC
jgi:hypothetical protein